VRRDCEPDRAWLLGPMGQASMYCAAVAWFPCFAPLALVAAPLSLTTWLLARRDLAKMRAGLMDPRGELVTKLAQQYAAIALGFLLFSAALLGWLLVMSVAV
jgi:hypothetical protein